MSEQQPRQSDEFARRLGTAASRLRRAARKAQPEVERQARTAAAAARPAAEKALRFVREHDREIKSAGTMGARAMASRVGPPALRPVMLVVADELVRDKGRPAPADDAPEADELAAL
ncbi:MAG: hypothetical protein U5Q44_10225 [Dehalococcoidia bacterium]|nr:hypothetical protein [Dehalococcoidia bacterium]